MELEPLRLYIQKTYHKDDIIIFVKNILINNPLIPEGRLNMIAKGLCNGFDGDFLSSSHILSFQIEEIFRNIIKNNSNLPITTSIRDSQKDININKILSEEKYIEVLKNSEYIEENLLLNLKYLLTDCYNIRNDIAHGLLDGDNFFSKEHLYLFWITARMIVYAQSQEIQKKNQSQA
jgi:hypothetical protein